MTYFSSFPTILYSNVVVTDVSRRVAMPPSVLRQPTAFAPYTVENQRADTVSFLYYGQDDDDWLISLANQMVDPYYGWFMDDDAFTQFIESKYGSVPVAQQRIVYWESNWASDYTNVSPSYYQALTPNLQKYWTPVYGNGPNAPVKSYSRRQEDWYQSTNMLAEIGLAANSTFQPGDLATVHDSGGNFQGTAEVVYSSGNTVTIKDVMGTWTPGWTVTSPNGNSAFSSFTVDQQVIPVDELVYFEPVTCYDYEDDLNQKNREIVLVQDSFRGVMYTELQNSLNSAAP